MWTIKKLIRSALRLPVKVCNRIKLIILSKSASKEKIKDKYERSFSLNANGKHDTGFYIEGFLHKEDKHFIIENIREKQLIIDMADRVIEHRFDLLGSGTISADLKTDTRESENISERFDFFKELQDDIQPSYRMIDWHRDFRSNYRWDPGTWYRRIKSGNITGADIKVPWELSRFNHLITLGQAYWVTGEEKYTCEFVLQLMDWIENNPVEFGVNWACTMDVSIRLCNWLYAAGFFSDSKYLTDGFWNIFIKMIYIHSSFIRKNLEKSFMLPSTNHYLADLTGLLYAGVFFRNASYGRSCLDFAIKELKKEIDRQVYDDGGDYEASTCYHRLVLELLFFPALVAVNSLDPSGEDYRKKCEHIFGKSYTDKLYRMFDVVLHLLKPDGKMPQIGDNDSGRLHIFSPKEILDMRYLLNLGAVFFNEPRFKIREFGYSDDCLWIFGKRGLNIWQDIKSSEVAKIASRSFSDTGWTVLRNDQSCMVISSGPNGQAGIGGHSHNDKLGFEFFADGKSLCIDTGTYLYTTSEKWRNNFRSTSYHNTARIDKVEQNRFSKGRFFLLEDRTRARINDFIEGNDYDLLDAQHSGYLYLEGEVSHRRIFKLYRKDSSVEIKDIISGTGKHLVEIFYNMPGVPENMINDDKLEVDAGEWKIYLAGKDKEDDIKLEEVKGYYSPEYGIKQPCFKVKYSFETELPSEIMFRIEKAKR